MYGKSSAEEKKSEKRSRDNLKEKGMGEGRRERRGKEAEEGEKAEV